MAALGMFDQGFYDKLGFGTGAYERELTFDPGILDVELPKNDAVRLTRDHAERCMRYSRTDSVVMVVRF